MYLSLGWFLWFLWVLWVALGLLGWAWKNHLLYGEYGGGFFNFGRTSALISFAAGLIGGLSTLLFVWHDASLRPAEQRYGLRFR